MKKNDQKELRTLAAKYPFTHVPHYIAVQTEQGFPFNYAKPLMCKVNHARRLRRAAKRGGANGLAEYFDKVSAKAENNIPVMEFHNKKFKERFMTAV
jgi:hypothetical protein